MGWLNTLSSGETGYIGAHELFANKRWIPCIMHVICNNKQDVDDPLEVYHNPTTHQLEVKIPQGKSIAVRQDLALGLTQDILYVALVDHTGKVHKVTPQAYRHK